jgi:hypothetical protein
MSAPGATSLDGLPGFALEETARVLVLLKRAPLPGDDTLDLQEWTVDDVTYIPVFTSAARLAQAFGEDEAVEAIEIELGLLRDLLRAHDAPLLGLIDPGAAHMAVFDPKA